MMNPQINPNHTELHRAKLRSAWTCFRWIECSSRTLHICPIWGIIYGLCGIMCRQQELSSYTLVVTPTHVIVNQNLYECGLCCHRQLVQEIPLSDVEQAVVVDNCCCGPLVQLRPKEGVAPMEPNKCDCCKPKSLLEGICIQNPRELVEAVERARANVKTGAPKR